MKPGYYFAGFGIFRYQITLIAAMAIKSIIALFLGLVIQFSQVPSSFASEPAKSCGVLADSPCCCEGLQSCPCAKEGNSHQKPAPLIPAAPELKPLISKAPEAINLDAMIPPEAEEGEFSVAQKDPAMGFPGVPFSVAFCRFLI